MRDEQLAFRPRKRFDGFDECVDQTAFQTLEVMRLPVVSRSWREQRIEGGLPSAVRMWRDDIDDRLAESPQFRHRFLAARHVPCPAHGKDQHVAAVPFLREERQGWGLA